MFRKRNVDHAVAVNGSSGPKPTGELSLLLDKLDDLVDDVNSTILNSMIENTNKVNNNGELTPRGTGLLRSLKKYRFRKAKEEEEIETRQTNFKNDDDITIDAKVPDDLATATPITTPIKIKPSKESMSSENKFRTKYKFEMRNKNPQARFVPMNDVDTACFVETVRRISELVVIGERAAATVQEEESKLDNLLRKTKNNKKIDAHDDVKVDEETRLQKDDFEEKCVRARSKIIENKEFAAVYELFFERNGLAMLSDILTGRTFEISKSIDKRKERIQTEIECYTNDEDKVKRDRLESILKSLDLIQEKKDYIVLLPPLAVAIQGFQSTSILVQNFKRATSLFFILSNGHINELIKFPLEEFHIAEREKLQGSGNNSSLMSPRRFGSPELGELTTTFVSFLKSLAMRMNAETLQFFLTYPTDARIESDTDYLEDSIIDFHSHVGNNDEDRPMDEVASNVEKNDKPEIFRPVSVKSIKVDFPLYERALEFCSSHHDSFVRTTAMNICFNTLRLATVAPKKGEEDPPEAVVNLEAATGASPDAVLHNAKPLPMRERLAIAQYVCTPSRVERLASPIFTRLAQLWGVLEEQYRDMEITTKSNAGGPKMKDIENDSRIQKSPNDKLARAREIARRQKYTEIFNETSYNVQDELLLLEDVLKIGLTSLNEQVIEMMFATFVYPLLLQPLLLYFQRSPITAEVLFADILNDHSLGRNIKESDATATEKAIISGPAKSALFCLSASFQILTNPPLLRLLFTAVFHPLSPDATGETMIRAKADVACMGPAGEAIIRIDRVNENGLMINSNDRETYIFGTITGRKEISGKRESQPLKDTCVFVLSPALSEILKFSGQDGLIVARSRHNPYRKAILQCLTLNKEVSDLPALAVMAVYSAVTVFDEKFLTDILFGLDIKRYRDNLHSNESSNSLHDSSHIDDDDYGDRGIGGSTISSVDCRLSLIGVEGGKVGFDYMNEVILSFKKCILNTEPGGKGAWKLHYDSLAAHALLSCIRGSSEAIIHASNVIEKRCRQSASFLADVPITIDRLNAENLQKEFKHLIAANGKTDADNLYYGAIMEKIFRKRNNSELTAIIPIFDHMFYLTKDLSNKEGDVSIYASVASLGTYKDVSVRSIAYTSLEQDTAQAAFSNSVESAGALLKLDAFCSLLNGLVRSKHILQDQKLGGLIYNRSTSSIVQNLADCNTIYSPISDNFDNSMFGIDTKDPSIADLNTGSAMVLVDKVTFPCVCEVPPSMAPLFSTEGAKVVSQGITWQSLYLVIMDQILVLVEPARISRGEGRIVTTCQLENLTVCKDPDNARVDTSARRMILICENPDLKANGMFRFEKRPQPKQIGPFSRIEQWKSSLDIWFEDSNAIHIALSKLDEAIMKARANRGNIIRNYLSKA